VPLMTFALQRPSFVSGECCRHRVVFELLALARLRPLIPSMCVAPCDDS